jgi:hypothetical protein
MMSSKPNTQINGLIIGYTTKEHLLLDLDETSLSAVSNLAILLIKQYPEIGHVLILSTSKPAKTKYIKFDAKGLPHDCLSYQNFHMVTDNIIGYHKCLEIIDVLVGLNVLQPEYKEIRQFRGDMTLRVSPKPLKGRLVDSPKIEMLIINRLTKKHDHKITEFAEFYNATKNINYEKQETEKDPLRRLKTYLETKRMI